MEAVSLYLACVAESVLWVHPGRISVYTTPISVSSATLGRHVLV